MSAADGSDLARPMNFSRDAKLREAEEAPVAGTDEQFVGRVCPVRAYRLPGVEPG